MSKTEVEGKQGHAPAKYFCTNKYSFFASVKCHRDHKAAMKMRYTWPPTVLGCYHIQNSGVCQTDKMRYTWPPTVLGILPDLKQ